jgi:hypothetical protein
LYFADRKRERVEISWVTEKGGLYDPTSPKNAGRLVRRSVFQNDHYVLRL